MISYLAFALRPVTPVTENANEHSIVRGGSRISRWGRGANPCWRGHQPPTQALFSENICKNERIWSCWGGAHRKLLYVDPPLIVLPCKLW